MYNIYQSLRNLAKTTKAQNLFVASKEIATIRLFQNTIELSKAQEFYLNWLYNYDSIMRDIILENISKHVTDNVTYTDSYLLWKKNSKHTKEEKKDKKKDVHLVQGKVINFPSKEDK